MTIPPFDGILNVLPPHLGNPADPGHLSPYTCQVEEVCQRFATTNERKHILIGFLNLREELLKLGIEGFQWVDGSFVEDIEVLEGRPPDDIDVVSFVDGARNLSEIQKMFAPCPDLLRRSEVKKLYRVDHFLIPLSSPPIQLVDNTRYWYGLFSHRRDQTWKGMLQVPLTPTAGDSAAKKILEKNP